MKKLFTEYELNSSKSKDLLPIECIECGKIFYKTKHYIKSIIMNPNQKSTGDYCSNSCTNTKKKKKPLEKICPMCGNVFKTLDYSKKYCSSICSHSRKQTEYTKNKISISIKNSEKAKNSILDRKLKEDKLTFKTCPICYNEMVLLPSEKNRIFCSNECCKKDLKFEFRKKPIGGIREGSGRSKSGWYKGYFCNSSYELVFVIYNIDHNILFKRNLDGFEYLHDGVIHKYFPDFIIDDTYYEIKGFLRVNDEYKFKYFPHKLKVMLKIDLIEMFDYVKSKYGNNFIELYEGNPHKIKNNICLICGNPAKNIYCSRKCSGIGIKK
ncbi:hypothetical protein M0Q50_06215 [bacterium]|jgi:hypothetical protein|nr:hypothetical protein [bacterium]